MPLKILILYCPTKQNGVEYHAMNFVKDRIKNMGHETVIIDALHYRPSIGPETHDHPMPGEIPVYSAATLSCIIKKADAFVVISAEDNYGIPRSLTDFMEHFVGDYFYRPAGIVTYSSDTFGGVRAATYLRSFLSEIGTVSIPTAIRMPKVQDFFNTKNEPVNDDYNMFMNEFLDELEWYSVALQEGRRRKTVPN